MTRDGSRLLTFRLTFHQPFLIGGGAPGAGSDATSRSDALIPGSSLKGAMRAAARVVGVDDALRREVFGGDATEEHVSARPSSWGWSDATPRDAFASRVRARIRLDGATHTVVSEALAVIEEFWQREGTEVTFVVEPMRYLDDARLRRHTAALQASSFAVTALGMWRNRGMGAVTVRPVTPEPDIASMRQVCHVPA